MAFTYVVAMSAVVSCTDVESTPDVCTLAAEHVAACTGDPLTELPPEGCVGEMARGAEQVLGRSCGELGADDDKADGTGVWCQPATRWMGRCHDEVALRELAAIDDLATVCPPARSDAVCVALRDVDGRASTDPGALAAYQRARDAVAGALTGAARPAALRDHAVRWFVREHQVALLAWNIVTARGTRPVGADYAARARAALAEIYPIYDPARFRLAALGLAPRPAATCTQPRIWLLFPGVLRLVPRDEMHEQIDAMATALPCMVPVRVDTGSFVDPVINARQAITAVAALGQNLRTAPIHLLGYSQGANNALRTLVDSADIRRRAASVFSVHSAAHGSEVGDVLDAIINSTTAGRDLCDRLPAFVRPLCDWAAAQSPQPADPLLHAIAWAMGVPLDQLESFIAAEDGVSAAPNLRAFFQRHAPGVRSLTTGAAREFWAEHGSALPTNIPYLSWRAVITDKRRNLPGSNALFHALLSRSSPRRPYNDMQVRLENQLDGGPIAATEIAGPVGEGNHWQWVVADGAVPPALMPASMTEWTPHREMVLSYYQSLNDLGLL